MNSPELTTVSPTPAVSRHNLLELSILPVQRRHRSIGTLGFTWIWIGIAFMIATFQLGATGVAGLPLPQVVAIILLANIVLALLMTLTADIGTEHGLSFAVYLRAPFGVHGTHIPSLFRGLVAAIWFGIQTYLGALALSGIVEYLTGFDNWALWYVIFAVVQIINTALGIKAVELLSSIAAPAIIAISVWMYLTLDVLAVTKGVNIWTFVGDKQLTIITLFLANVAFWSTLAIDIPNITRHVRTPVNARGFLSRNRHIFLAQLVALPLTQTWIAVIGAASFIAAGDWNPINVIQAQSTGLSLVVLMVLVVLAQWSTNTAANLIPAALTFVNAGAPRVRYPTAVVIAGVIGTLSMPWAILDNLFAFLFSYGSFLSAIGGIMVADYYLIRRRRLNVPQLYELHGQFHYWRGFNPAGLLAWAAASALAYCSGDWAFVVGFVSGLVIHAMLMKFWIVRRYPQQELTGNGAQWLASSVGHDWRYDASTDRFGLTPSDQA
ncbi:MULTISPECIES: NCS1 family transporter [Pseudomonas]|uniref:NCS1 family transporter n=1 Tax=Pseudomonas putida TaxID=303 RepID=A0AAW6PID1_PSEPU|nr:MULTISPECIES: NCS1 family transporter [Pseudomonas]CAI3809546.1 Hydantoin permease [Pseudomonas sp. MM223]CAI3809935.1 Hydantoin permease [Pseudomonas sp. MM221]KPM64742.1 nitrate reductase [Pseudomonas putida]MDF3869736.1 NCS1 family transporter [Pseudomonas putida]MDF3875538.1 NCS1 family transporter [Pseudomonas putida]